MIQVKVLQASNDIGLESLVNRELLILAQDDCKIKDIQFQHTSILIGEGTRPSYAAMITYDDNSEEEQGYIRDEEDELDVQIQRD